MLDSLPMLAAVMLSTLLRDSYKFTFCILKNWWLEWKSWKLPQLSQVVSGWARFKPKTNLKATCLTWLCNLLFQSLPEVLKLFLISPLAILLFPPAYLSPFIPSLFISALLNIPPFQKSFLYYILSRILIWTFTLSIYLWKYNPASLIGSDIPYYERPLSPNPFFL